MIALENYELLSFDCYGTIIDWERGILDALAPLLDARAITIEDETLLAFYARAESKVETGPYTAYAEVLGRVVGALGRELGFAPEARERACLARSLPGWPAFADSADALATLASTHRLAILSNVDDALLAETVARNRLPIDVCVTAERARCYKPDARFFEVAAEVLDVPRERWLHVAQSLFHDVVPAKASGLACVHVDRRAGRAGGATPPADAVPDLVVPDLAGLARAR